MRADEVTHEQGRALRRHLWSLLARWSAVYVLVFAALALFVSIVVSDALGPTVLNATARNWVTVEAGEVDNYLYATGKDRSELQMIPQEDGTVAIRDLSLYYRLRSARRPVAAALFLLGYLVIVAAVLRRSVAYFEELSGAVSGLMRNREQPVHLSGALSIAQGELNELREGSLAQERAAADAERRKNELVAYLAHDIRTPLTSVVGYLSLLDEAPDLPEAQRRRYVATALAKAETLDALTTEFFEITRYNLSSIPIERTDVDVRLFLEQLADEFLPELQARGLSARVDAPIEGTMRADGGKMARAVGNVVRNALAYADAGTEVLLRARRLRAGGWRLSVTDRGREIAPEHLESIFDRFFRADDARASTGNAGLGLAIAREIVRAHGGTIRATSEDGLTTFTIELP